jgi:hypothetical protein
MVGDLMQYECHPLDCNLAGTSDVLGILAPVQNPELSPGRASVWSSMFRRATLEEAPFPMAYSGEMRRNQSQIEAPQAGVMA